MPSGKPRGRAVNNADYDPTNFAKVFSGGNISLNLATLPNRNTEATKANAEHFRSGNYYTSHIFYNYRLETDNTNFTAGISWLSKDSVGRGLIWNTMSSTEQATQFSIIRIGLGFFPNWELEFAAT
jgi:hypothetical protein